MVDTEVAKSSESIRRIQVDHFRGLAGFWAVTAEAKVVMVGLWKVGPGKPLFDAISQALGKINIIAEYLIQGWWDNLNHGEKAIVLKYLATDGENDMPWMLIQAIFSSVARTAIIPMQDILCLGSSAWMDAPATEVSLPKARQGPSRGRSNAYMLGNWSWRLPSSMTFESLGKEAMTLKDMLSLYGLGKVQIPVPRNLTQEHSIIGLHTNH